MSTPDLMSIPALPRDDEGPTFAEPWQAQAFGLAVRLSAEGHFTWHESAAALAEELKAAADRGEPDDGSRYYEHWLAALERLVTSKGLTDTAALAARKARGRTRIATHHTASPLFSERPNREPGTIHSDSSATDYASRRCRE